MCQLGTRPSPRHPLRLVPLWERRGANWDRRRAQFLQMSRIQIMSSPAANIPACSSAKTAAKTKRAEPNVPILEMSAMLALPGENPRRVAPPPCIFRTTATVGRKKRDSPRAPLAAILFGAAHPRVDHRESLRQPALCRHRSRWHLGQRGRRGDRSSAMTTHGSRPTSNFAQQAKSPAYWWRPVAKESRAAPSRATNGNPSPLPAVGPTAMHSPKTTRGIFIWGSRKHRRRTWLRAGRAKTAIFKSQDGATYHERRRDARRPTASWVATADGESRQRRFHGYPHLDQRCARINALAWAPNLCR